MYIYMYTHTHTHTHTHSLSLSLIHTHTPVDHLTELDVSKQELAATLHRCTDLSKQCESLKDSLLDTREEVRFVNRFLFPKIPTIAMQHTATKQSTSNCAAIYCNNKLYQYLMQYKSLKDLV